MKIILKIIFIILLLSPIIAKALHYNPFLDFNMLNNTDTKKKQGFWDTIENMTVEEMQNLLDQGFDVNKDYHGTTIFTRIVGKGKIDVVALLIKTGVADIHATSRRGTALHEAAYHNKPEIIQLLIDAGADIEAKTNKYNTTPLHKTAIEGSLDAARKLLELGADVNAVAEDDGTTIFMSAVSSASQPDSISDTNIYAGLSSDEIREKQLAMLKLLIEYGADPHAVDNDGNNARSYIYRSTNEPYGNYNRPVVKNYLDELGVK